MLRDDFQPGSTLGRYEILRKLAVGGMAQIYLARVRATAGFEKLVVLKRISPIVAEDQAFVQMFLAEARLAATLRHPNIADVFDIGAEDGSYYFAMEFIHGQDARSLRLAAAEQQRTVPLEVALGIVTGTAYALAYAHAKEGPTGPLGIVHRDVSPSNILVSYDGAVKLVDFGIARAETRKAQVTHTGMLKGKVPYMSPEQCKGQALDRRCDIFSLGTVFYELTCGVRPFDGHSEYDTLDMIARGRLRRPSTHVPEYPPALETIVLRMLAREPDERYQSADDVLADLERFISDQGVLVSERVVAKYMRELFADEIAEWEDPGTLRGDEPFASIATGTGDETRPGEPTIPLPLRASVEATREYPKGRPPTLDDQPTAEVHIDEQSGEPMQPLLVTPDVQVFIKRAGSTVPPIAEPPARAPSPPPTRPAHWPRVPMPDRNRPTGVQPRIRPTRPPDFQDESPTLRPEDVTSTTRPTRPPDFVDESPTEQTSRSTALRQLADVTRRSVLRDTAHDGALPFDPLLARGDDLLDEIDRDAPPDETTEQRAARRINELVARVTGWLVAGEIDQAVVAAELAFEEEHTGERARQALAADQPTLEAAFEAYLGDLDRSVGLFRPREEVQRLDLLPPARHLLSKVETGVTVRDLLDDPGMPRLDTSRWLCRMLLRKIIILA